MNCVRRHGEPLVDDPVRLDDVAALGIDEHKMLSANGEHHTEYVTCFVDVIRGRLLDIVRGRNADDVAFWLSQAPGSWLQDIEAVAIDPHRGYLKGILSYLPDTVVTVDCFHGVKLANSMVDDIRRRVQQESTGHRGRKQDPLFCTRRDDSFKPRGDGNTSVPGVGHSPGHWPAGSASSSRTGAGPPPAVRSRRRPTLGPRPPTKAMRTHSACHNPAQQNTNSRRPRTPLRGPGPSATARQTAR